MKWGLTPLTMLLAVTANAVELPQPYPDVWHLEIANAPKGINAVTYVALLSDNDVLVAAKADSSANLAGAVMRTFFHARPIDSTRTNLGKGVVTYADGSTATIVRGASYSLTLGDGSRLRNASNVYRRCYRGPARDYVVKRHADGSRINRVFFLLLDEPEAFENETQENNLGTGSLCPTEEAMRLEVSVVSTGCAFLELPDGTILCRIADRAFVQRLNPDLTTPAKSMNRKLFGFPILSGDSTFVSTLTGKDYGSNEAGDVRFQEALDDLHDHLISLRDALKPM